MSRILHIVPGTDDVTNGMVVVAKLLAGEQGGAEVVDLNHEIHEKGVEEVWVHGMWLPKEWLACWRALKKGKRLVRMTHGSLSPVYLRCQSPFKKWLVGPIERYLLRKADKIVATCEAESDWIRGYLGEKCPPIEVTDIKRFFKLGNGGVESGGECSTKSQLTTHNSQLHLLYLGRRHPLKGLTYLESTLATYYNMLSETPTSNSSAADSNTTYYNKCPIEFRAVSNAFGVELEKVWGWCDVLILPTLSDNFGLVIAEALERGKCVITTDGAPAWDPSASATKDNLDGTYDGRLIYLRGYRDGSPEVRVNLLKSAIESLTCCS